MDWTEVCIEIDAENIDRAADIANMAVPYGIYIEDYRHLEEETREIANIDLIDEALLQKDRTKGLVHLYISPEDNPKEAVAFLSERFAAAGIAPDGRQVLWIEPGLAFGTGGHHTTSLCLETLEAYITPGCSVLDTGCGSGILSIAALLLGADAAVGVDIDALAVKTAVENGERNGFRAPRYRILQGNLADKVEGQFDVVVANIVADIILLFAPDVGKFMKKDAVFIASGIIDERGEEVVSALLKSGLLVVERREQSGWLCLVCKKTA